MENLKNWYVVHTKPKFERKVADVLEKKKIENYYPRYSRVQYWQEKRKVINAPLFRSLVFVYASEKQHDMIKQIDGVSGILYWLNKPAIINEDEIRTIRYFLEQYDDVRLEKIQIQAVGNVDNSTNFSQVQSDGTISFNDMHRVSLPSLGYALVSESVLKNVKVVA